jgi:hypothetical protein
VCHHKTALECPISQQDHMGEGIAFRHVVMPPHPYPRAIVAYVSGAEGFDEHQGTMIRLVLTVGSRVRSHPGLGKALCTTPVVVRARR